MVLVVLADHLLKHLDGDGLTLLLLLDLTAVFIKVDCDFLTHCLADAGVDGVDSKWLSSVLLDWGQRVVLEERVSKSHPLTCGVLQGAVFSPIFNICIHSLGQLVKSFKHGCHQ